MTITDSTLNNSVWLAVKNRVVSGLSTDGISASVDTSYNNKKLSKPIVVIPPFEKGKSELKFGNTSGRYDIAFNILVLASNTLDVDTVSQSVENSLEADDIVGISYEGHLTSYDFQEINDAPYHIKNVSINYTRE